MQQTKSKAILDETLMSELFGVDYPRITLPEQRQCMKKSDNIKNMQSKETYNELFLDIFGVNSTDKIVMPVKEKEPIVNNVDLSPYRQDNRFLQLRKFIEDSVPDGLDYYDAYIHDNHVYEFDKLVKHYEALLARSVRLGYKIVIPDYARIVEEAIRIQKQNI